MTHPFQLDPTLRRGVVFQSERPIRIQGSAPTGKTVHLDFLSMRKSVRAENGRFCFELPAMGIRKTPFAFRVRQGFRSIEVADCLIGDVYLMIGGTEVWSRFDRHENDAHQTQSIRVLNVPEPQKGMGPWEADRGWRWEVPSTDSVRLSTLVVQFATELHRAIDRPVGVVVAARPSAGIATMIDPALFYRAHQFERLAQDILAKETDSQRRADLVTGIADTTDRPGDFFESLIVPVSGHTYAGIVFAQEVADPIDPELLEDALRLAYHGWRNRLGTITLPIILAQIADCLDVCLNANRHALIREAQRRTLDIKKHVYLATSAVFEQLGPQRTTTHVVLADRLVKVVLEKIHHAGRNLLSPTYFSHTKKNGIVVYTDFNMLPLVSRSRRNLGFSVSYDGVTFEPVTSVKLVLNQIVLEGIQNAKEIRYDFIDHPVSDIGSQNGLPLLPFRLQLN